MINYQCFEKIAMSGNTQESETIRMYFIKLREFMVENQKMIYQSIENKNDLNIYRGVWIYLFFCSW